VRTARRTPIRVVTPKAPSIAPKMETKTDAMADDVIAALMAAGYKKPIATEAALGCGQAERATIEHWTRAALRRCAKGVAS
jgi:Holliday junction resolvasome RuvABC DNA-binding subunit